MQNLFFARDVFKAFILSAALISTAGCVAVVGGVGLVGGYAVSPDTVEGVTKDDEETVWEKALEIVAIMGQIKEKYETAQDLASDPKKQKLAAQLGEGKILIAQVSGARVVVSVVTANDVTKLRVKARKAFLPKIAVAQDVFTKIISHLTE